MAQRGKQVTASLISIIIASRKLRNVQVVAKPHNSYNYEELKQRNEIQIKVIWVQFTLATLLKAWIHLSLRYCWIVWEVDPFNLVKTNQL